VVFRKPLSDAPSVTSIEYGGRPLSVGLVELQNSTLTLLAPANGIYEATLSGGRALRKSVDDLPAPIQLESEWELSFPSIASGSRPISLAKLVSWTMLPGPDQKYFSGAAIYRKTVTVPAPFIASENRCYLDLGRVEVIAEVKWNGNPIATLWRPPFIVDITEAIRPGANALEIKVVNLWPNRIIGDDQLPDDCDWSSLPPGQIGTPLVEWPKWLLDGKPRPSHRSTFSTWKFYAKDSPLLDSGLLGPVAIKAVRLVPLE
jgi:hypothetical protein